MNPKQKFLRLIAAGAAVATVMVVVTGCGKAPETESKAKAVEEIRWRMPIAFP